MTTISWKSIEHDWAVECSGGERIGKVFLVVGDENTDIFDGLAITRHGGSFVFHNYTDRPHYVPAEQSAQIEPESAGRMDRLETWFEHKTGQDRTE